jgi:hypothetical protein
VILRSRLGSILLLGYIAIFLLALGILFNGLVFHSANSELSGVLAIFVTLPWSLMLAPVWSKLGYVDWYNQFASSSALYGLLAMVTTLPGAIANGCIAYWMGKAIERGFVRR